VSKPNYVCSLCKKDFSRKSNANRHDLNQHQGLAEIVRVGDHILREKSFVAKTKYRNDDGLFDIDPKEARLLDILEKLVPRFEEMERVLSNPNLKEKEMLCGQAIIDAISSPDPIRAMTIYLDSIRKDRSVPQMINYVALSLGVSPIKARESLKNMIV
jgi:hypothetical protein